MTTDLALFQTAADALRPDPLLTVSEWADAHRHLTTTESPEPGPWRTERVPYMREIMDTLSPSSPVTDVCFMKSAQVGGTEAGNNWVGFVIHHSPGPMLAVQPTVEVAERVSKQRIAPLISNSPVLAEKVGPPRSRDSSNTLLAKEFPGGMLIMAGANSAAGLRSMPIRYLFLDEIDGYPNDVDGEGDPVLLAEQRTQNFRGRKKKFKVSTPTLKGFSRIEKEYEDSDQRRFYVPCPECGEYQVLQWSNVKWENSDPQTAVYVCDHCGGAWDDHARIKAVRRGEWRATHPERKKRGYHIWAAYSPWVRLHELVSEFLSAKSHPELLKTFVNTKLGETWEEQGERVTADGLKGRLEEYAAEVPKGVGLLTAAVDVQGDRLELKVKGWGAGEESWRIAHEILWGDPGREEVWEKLAQWIDRPFQHECGSSLHIRVCCIDTGGHHAASVYRFCAPRQPRVWAIKGANKAGVPIWGRPSRVNKFRARLVPIGTDTAKDLIFARMKITHAGPGYMHLPVAAGAVPDHHCGVDRSDDEYLAQLTSEKVVTRYHKGRPIRSYEKTRVRNEALDLEVYNLAALHSLGAMMINSLGTFAAALDVEPDPEPESPHPTPAPRPSGGWLSGWKMR